MKSAIKLFSILSVVMLMSSSVFAANYNDKTQMDGPKMKTVILPDFSSVEGLDLSFPQTTSTTLEGNSKYTPNQMAGIVGLWNKPAVKVEVEEVVPAGVGAELNEEKVYTPEQLKSILEISF